MKAMSKRILSLLLAAVMVVCLLPGGLIGVAASGADAPSPEDYALVDALFDEIEAMEDSPAKKSSTQTQLTDAAEQLVLASDNYVEGSLERNGDFFSWLTDEGIRCCYSPRMRQIEKDMTAPANATADGAYNEPVATKGGWPSGNQVYLIGPYYGYDDSFTDQYKNEASAIATAIGDTDGYTLYSGTAATVDTVATAVSDGAVVIFDSHGSTDYENGYDYVTGATSSYLCLTSTSGLTTEDYNDGALYYSDGIFINGATIANHMTANSPAGIVWMAICLGMATDTMCEPLREKGVEVVYGYSQSVTFAGDYLYEETFWDEMSAGNTVADSIATMKSTWGNWDWSTKIATYYGYTDGYSTISAARADYAAFPIVVSDEDTHPGQRSGTSSYGADSLQTVNSTYTLFTQYDITAQVNNSAYGSAFVSNNTITATPAEGYFAQGYTVVSGSATVTQNGNSFVVNAQSDCTIQINFAAKTAVTVGFSGAEVSEQTGYAGDAMTLPTVSAPEGYTFLGWMDSALTGDTTEKPSYYTTSFTPTGNTTLYALYSYVDANSGTGSGDYVKVEASRDDWSGEYLIVYETGGLALDSSLSTLDAVNNYAAVTITDNTISAEEGDPYKFTVAAYEGGYSIQAVNGEYIGQTTNANGLATDSAAIENAITLDASGNANIVSGGAYLRYNSTSNQNRFRYYKSSSYSNQQPVALYLKDGTGGTVYYTGTTVICEHTNTTNVAAKDATCYETGYTAGVYCNDCDTYISGHETVPVSDTHVNTTDVAEVPADCTTDGTTAGVYCNDCQTYVSGHETIAASGHSYESVVTAPTATAQGYTTYTCPACGDSYVGDYTPALGETYTVSFSTPAGVTAPSSMSCNSSGITLPEAGVPTGNYEYTFLGWVIDEYDNVTDRPTCYAAGETFVATANTTLIALYTYAVGGSGTSEYVLTELTDISSTDTVVITMTASDGTVYALNSSNGSSSAPTATTVTVASGKLTAEPDTALQWNISGSDASYVIYPNGVTDSWLYCTNANNGVRVGTNANNTFSVTDGYLYNTATSRYVGVYTTNPDWRCYTSINSNISGQTLGFYVKSDGGISYYTTVISTSDGGDEGGDEGDNEETFTLTFKVPAGFKAITPITANGSVTLPEATVRDKISSLASYTFLGWVDAEYDNVTEMPTYYAAGSTYMLTADTTLRALFTYSIETEEESSGSAEQSVVFELGDNGTAAHSDGSNQSSYSEIAGDYTLSLTASAQFYTGAYDAKGNSAIKLGSSKNVGGFTFTVPDEVTSVIIKAAQYKANTTKLSVNGTTYTLTSASNNGEYEDIVVDTTSTKTITVTTVSGGTRAMINSIAYTVAGTGSGNTTTVTTTYYTTMEGHAADVTFAIFAGSTVSLGDVLDLHFYIDATANYFDGQLTATFTYTTRTGETVEETIVLSDTYVDAYNAYKIISLDLPAAYMATSVSAVLTYNGESVDELTYSIRDYGMALINGSYADSYKSVAKAMLNYGAWAQNYFGYIPAEGLADAEMTDADKLTDTDTALAKIDNIAQYAAVVTNKASNFIGYSLLLKDVTSLRLYFTEEVTATVNGTAVTAVKDGDADRYYIQLDGVNAADLDKANTIVCGDMTISNLSVLSPAAIVAQNESKATNFRNAMIALILYAQSVNNL